MSTLANSRGLLVSLKLWLLVALALNAAAQDLNTWRAIEQRSYTSCPSNVFSTSKVPALCDTTSTSTGSSTSTSSSTSSSSSRTTVTTSRSTSQTVLTSTVTSFTDTSTTSSSQSVTSTDSVTRSSFTSTSSVSSTVTIFTTTSTSMTTSRTSTVSTTSVSSTSTSFSSTSTSITGTSSSSVTSSSSTATSLTHSSSTSSSATLTTSFLGSFTSTTSQSSSSTTVTGTSQTVTSSTETSVTRTTTSKTNTLSTTMSSTSSSTTRTSMSQTSTSSVTSSSTSATSSSSSTSMTSTTSSSVTLSVTSTTVQIQPCGNLCPLFGLSGCNSIQSGEQCRPELLVDPCIDYNTALELTCPENNVELWRLPDANEALPMTKCRVCGFGTVGDDKDLRKGYYESDIFFGQNSIESMITEEPIMEYRVYLVDDVQRPLTSVLAVVPKVDGEDMCCRTDSYRAHIFTVLPRGYKRFMVVPVSNFGKEMPAGTLSEEVVDQEAGEMYHLGIFPSGNFSFLVGVADEMKAGNGSLALRSPQHEVQIPCTRLQLLDRWVVVPVLEKLMPSETYEVLFDQECLIMPSSNETADLVSPAHGLHFQTEDENVTDDGMGPRLLNAHATVPLNGALESTSEFHFFFDKVALRGPGPLALVHQDTAMVDPDLLLFSHPAVPGMVVVRPRSRSSGRAALLPGRYELVFGPGALQDVLGNMAHSSKSFQERSEWEHRVACFFGDCGETPPFGLDDYVIQVPVEGAQAIADPDAPWSSFPTPGQMMFKHENLVLDFTHPVHPGLLESGKMELCSNWTVSDVCPMKRVIHMKDMLFVGSKVIINPPQDLDPGYVYNVSIHEGVIAGLKAVYADVAGRFNYSIQIAPEESDRHPPVLLAIEVVCEEANSEPNATARPMGGVNTSYGCGVWLPAERINGKPPLWGFHGLAAPAALPPGSVVSFRFVFREPVQLRPGAVILYTSETTSVSQQVPASVGTQVEDSVVTAVPLLLPGHLYTLELVGVTDLASWPEPNLMDEGAALTFFTPLSAPNISLASNDGLKEADPSSVIKLTFQGPAKLADPFSVLEAEVLQVNPVSDMPDRQLLRLSDPDAVVFFGHEVLFLPRPLLAGTSYRFSLPAGAVLHFTEPLNFLFATRSEDLMPPSIVWTWPTGTLSKLQIDRMLVQIYFSEAVQATPGAFVLLHDNHGDRHVLPVDQPCPPGANAGCMQMDMEGRRVSLMPAGRLNTGEMIPWAQPGRTYQVEIDADTFSDAGTVGELRKNPLPASSFSFSIHPDTEGPVLFSSEPSNNSGYVEPVLQSILLVFDEEIQAVQSDFSVLGSALTRPMEVPQLEMLPGVIELNPEVGIITLTFTIDVEAGSGFFHILQRDDSNLGGNVSEYDVDFIKEVPVEEAIFVKNQVMLNPFPLPLPLRASFFVGSNQSAVTAAGGSVTLAMELDTLAQANVQFRITATMLRLVYTSWRDWRCFTKLMDVELYMNEHILGLNTSDRAISLRAEDGHLLWRLWADEMKTDEGHLQVTIDPMIPFKATIRASQIPAMLPGGSSMPLPHRGGLYMLEVDEGLFLDRPEEIQENVTVEIPVGATCSDYNFSCGGGRELIENASFVRCASRDACTIDDNVTCCEDMDEERNETACNGTNCSEELKLGTRRLMALEPLQPTFEIQTLTYLEVEASPVLHIAFRVCETRYQDLDRRSARIYVPLEVQRSEINGRLRPQQFEVYIPSTAVQDTLGNFPQDLAMISFTHDLEMPQLDVMNCHPLNRRNATEQESIQLSFSEAVKAGAGYLELWDIDDLSGPKISIDVQMLAAANPNFFGRKLIDGHVVSLFPDLLCAGGCGEWESGVTYVLATSNSGVLYDMMDNPLPILDTNHSGPGGWRFDVNENVTRPPEVLRFNYEFNMTSSTAMEVHGYVYFTQRVYPNASFPGTAKNFAEIQITDCGSDFDCSSSQAIDSMIYVEPWGSTQPTLESSLVHFLFEANQTSHLFQVVVASYAFMGADTNKGSLAGPVEPYSFWLETGPDPRRPPDRPFLLPGGVSPTGDRVSASSQVTLVFSEEVQRGSGNISFCSALIEDHCTLGFFADGSPSLLDVEAARVTKRWVSWQPQDFAFGQTLHMLIPEGLFVSADGRMVPVGRSRGEYRFSIREGDVVPPHVIAVEPTDRRDGVVQMIFSEAVIFQGNRGSQGTMTLETSEGNLVPFTATADGAVVSIHGPFHPGESYQLRNSASVLLDIMRNPVDINIPFHPENFTISDDMIGPRPSLWPSGARRVAMHDVFYVLFDEAVVPHSAHCQLHSLPPDSCGVTCGRREVLVDLTADVHHYEQGGRLRSFVEVDPGRQLLPGFGYHLLVERGFVQDSVGNPSEAMTATYLVELQRDVVAPHLLLATINGHGGPVASVDQDDPQSRLELYFSEVVSLEASLQASSVVLHLLPSDGGDRCAELENSCMMGQNCSFPCGYTPASQNVSIPKDALEIRGAVASVPSHGLALESNRGYRLHIHLELFVDLRGNAAGAAATAPPELVFRVRPREMESPQQLMLLSSMPMDGETMVAETSSLQLVFNVEVQAGQGDLLLLPLEVDDEDHVLNTRMKECEEGCNESNDSWWNGSNHSMDGMDEAHHAGLNHSEVPMNLSNDTEPWLLDPNVTGAIRVPARQCHIRDMTVTCTLTALAQGMTYRIYWMDNALQDLQGQWFPAPTTAPQFRVIDMPFVFPRLLSLEPSSRSLRRRLDGHGHDEDHRYAMEPKPAWYAAKGAILAMSFSTRVQLGSGHLRLVDCSPGNTLRCFDDDAEKVHDEEVMSIEVSAPTAAEHILLEGRTVFLVSRLRPGRRHALRLDTLGIFVDEFGIPLLPTSSEFWVQADDERPPEIFMQVPVHGGEAARNSNITLFFSEALQADVSGVINISDGIQEELIPLSATQRGQGYVILRGSTVIINPALDFSAGRPVTVNFEPGVFKDFAGNPFPGLMGEEYIFHTAPAHFQRMARYLQYPNFREQRFTPREGALFHFVNGSLLIFSGMADGFCLADTWVSRTGSEWRQVNGVESQSHTKLFPLVAHTPSAVDKEGCIWILGGQCNNDPGTIWKTCDIGRSWYPLARPTPIPFRGQVPAMFPMAFRDHGMTILGGWQLVVVDASPGSSEAVWRFNSWAADFVQRVAGETALPFGLRREPKLLATSEGGLYLVGGHFCDGNDDCSFNDVWFSPDIGESWHCKTRNYLAKDPSVMQWPGVGKGFNAVITQDDTIYVMAGHLPGTQEASAFVYESFQGAGDIYLTDSQPYFIMPGSSMLNQAPVPPQQSFTLFFGEEIALAEGAMVYFHQQPSNLTAAESETNFTRDTMVESDVRVHGKDLILQPRDWLLPGRYQVHIPAGHVQDLAGNPLGEISGEHFEVEVLFDSQEPFARSMYPPDGSIDVEPWTRITLTMSEEVVLGHGHLKVTPAIAYGASLELPVDRAVAVLHKVIFQLPPGERFTPDMEYVVTMPAGLLRDHFGNEVQEQICGNFSTLSGFITTSNYSGAPLPMMPPPRPELEDFPKLLATWPFNGARDVPPRPGLEVWLYFEEEVQWTRDGTVLLSNETHVMAAIPTNDHHIARNSSAVLQLVPAMFAAKIRFPPQAVLRPSLRYTVTLTAGALEDVMMGNRTDEIRMSFLCLQNSYGNAGPKLVASDLTEHMVAGSKHVFRFWYDKDIVKTTDQKPPVQMELPTGEIIEVPGESENVTIHRNALTVVFPQHVMGRGGMVTLRMPRFIFVDVLQRFEDLVEGGGQPPAMEEVLMFSVQPENMQRPSLNLTLSYPPTEEVATYEFPWNGRIRLAFSEEVMGGPGFVTFLPRSPGAPHVMMPGHRAITAGQFAMIDLNLPPGEVYNVSLDADSFLNLDGYSMESRDDSYVFSTKPLLRFRQLGQRHWADPALQVPGGRLGASATVDDVNRIFLLGGHSPSSVGTQGRALNDVWRLDTYKEVNCASAYEGETACSKSRCEAGSGGTFDLGSQSFVRDVWRARSVSGSDCITSTGHRRSELGGIISTKSLRCPCPTCTSHPGPPEAPLPSDMLNDFYVQDYILVPSGDTRPLLCAPGMTPTGNFSCRLDSRYFAKFDTPYPTCENSSCQEPPDVSTMENFAAWDAMRSTGNIYCPDISSSNPLVPGGFCTALCAPGWKVDGVFRCQQGEFQAPMCWRQTCEISSDLSNGRLDCEEYGGPLFNATCNLLCEAGYIPSNLQSTCQTTSSMPEAVPSFLPSPRCMPGSCAEYEWLTGGTSASIQYTSDSRNVTTTALLTCSPGYFPAGSAFGLENPVELRCGPVLQQENEAEVEWKLTRTGARAGLICAPDGMAVYDTVALIGTIQLTLNLPNTMTRDSLCTQFKDRFLGDVSLALVMALSSAGQVGLPADAMDKVTLNVCTRRLDAALLATRGRALQTTALDTSISFTVKVANDQEAVQLQFAVMDPDASGVFKRVFSLALLSSSGVEATGIVTLRMTRSILYIIGEPDGTQVSVVKGDDNNDTGNQTESNETGTEEENFLNSPVFIGLVAGGSTCCCCCCVVCCYLRRRYMVDVYADWEESEEEDFEDDKIVDIPDDDF